jgi:hypothetical protein
MEFHPSVQQQQKNIMEQLGHHPTGLNTARNNLAGCGTQTAALAFGGETPPNTGATEEYDGSTWTSSPASLATARGYLAGAGTQTSALAFGGIQPPASAATEEWTGAGTINSYNHSFLTFTLSF